LIFKVVKPKKILWSLKRVIVEIDDIGITDVPIQYFGNAIFKPGNEDDYVVILIGERMDNLFGILYYYKEEPASTNSR
jgi:hypothetical protein